MFPNPNDQFLCEKVQFHPSSVVLNSNELVSCKGWTPNMLSFLNYPSTPFWFGFRLREKEEKEVKGWGTFKDARKGTVSQTLFDLQTRPNPSLPPSMSLSALTSLSLSLSLSSWLCWQRRRPHPFTLHPAGHLGSFLLPATSFVVGLAFFGQACLENVSLLSRIAFTPPPPRLCYILPNKPERTNISSLQILPLALKPHFHLELTYDSQQI